MNSALLAVAVFILYIIAYRTYGRFLARKIFKTDRSNPAPSHTLRDDVDFVPTKKWVLFGHHFASIAGTGPIVGPAIAVIWGWLPALLWVVFGSIFMGAVHDFGALVLSMRNDGRSIGDISGSIVNRRVKLLFLLIIFFALMIVIAIFGAIMAVCFDRFPSSIFPVWVQIPIAVALGWCVYRRNFPVLPLTIIAVVLMYASILVGAFYPVKEIPSINAVTATGEALVTFQPVAVWVVVLLIYAYIASTLPVQTLLQPRDYINAYQLFIAMALLALGILVTRPEIVAPASRLAVEGAPPLFPMLFVIIACGAVSGFHSLVSSGTSSKQISHEGDALFVGYGSMLTEGMLALFVIIACTAGLGMGLQVPEGMLLEGGAAFEHNYGTWSSANKGGLSGILNAFVTGSENMISGTGIPREVAAGIIGVFIVSFAATTLDTATRIQRYVVGELAQIFKAPFFARKHPATTVAVLSAAALAFYDTTWGEHIVISGGGGYALWPLFGCTNQLLAGLALLVITVYLARKKAPIMVTLIPMLFMVVVCSYALALEMNSFLSKGRTVLFSLAVAILCLEAWMILESLGVIWKVYFRKCCAVENEGGT